MSGDSKTFDTGAVRSKDADEFRYNLISPIGLREVARTYAEGEQKYGDFNWERGMPVHDLLNHALKHIYDFLEHGHLIDLSHAAWNVLSAIHSYILWPHLNRKHLRTEGCVPPKEAFDAAAVPADGSEVGRRNGVGKGIQGDEPEPGLARQRSRACCSSDQL